MIVSRSIDEFSRQRCNPAETLQKIQRDPLCFQDRASQSINVDDQIAGSGFGAIGRNNPNLCGGIDPAKNFGCCFGAGHDCFFTRNDSR